MSSTLSRIPSFILLSVALACSTCASTNPSSPGGAGEASAAAKPTTVEEQIALGGKAYGEFCASCHGDGGQGTDKGPKVVGAGALPLDPPADRKFRKAQFRTAMDVAQFVVTAMPPGDRPKPSQEQYWAILAFDLNANGVKLTQLTGPDNAAAIVIHP